MEKNLAELIQSRDEMLKRLDAISKDLRGGLDADSKEQAIQLENIPVLEEIARVTQQNLQQINRQIATLQKNA